MEQKCNSIFFGHVLKFPMKMLENSRALSVRATVTQGWMVLVKIAQRTFSTSLPSFSLLLFRVPRQRVFLGYGCLLSEYSES